MARTSDPGSPAVTPVSPAPARACPAAVRRSPRGVRPTSIVRKAARTARLLSLSSRPAVAARETLMGLSAKPGPGAAVRVFDGIADWRPPQRTYADRAPQGRMAQD
ncbi:hypothetical protein [Streptomyces jumonjinensis]|uniref:Uncharacterized protein n=1 Tax=Streptomyces jumonjinensis TaxID=1945 RepID=A0A646KG02_STRJU|nr:hypothetical protein [Streptomyces jumonjinensis]MQT00927.1 hypothetical protein [Streptomyces jumonjinensis]